jgi:glyceraldehyde-3-phosphate dehydrogenase/erythrose-4-phosphate dehydrogenase
MAAKKGKAKKTRTVYRKKKTSSRKAQPWHVATATGLLMSAGLMATARSGGNNNSPVDLLRNKQYSGQARVNGALHAIARNATSIENWTPAAAGAIVSGASKLPVIKMVGAPISKTISKASHKKAVL